MPVAAMLSPSPRRTPRGTWESDDSDMEPDGRNSPTLCVSLDPEPSELSQVQNPARSSCNRPTTPPTAIPPTAASPTAEQGSPQSHQQQQSHQLQPQRHLPSLLLHRSPSAGTPAPEPPRPIGHLGRRLTDSFRRVAPLGMSVLVPESAPPNPTPVVPSSPTEPPTGIFRRPFITSSRASSGPCDGSAVRLDPVQLPPPPVPSSLPRPSPATLSPASTMSVTLTTAEEGDSAASGTLSGGADIESPTQVAAGLPYTGSPDIHGVRQHDQAPSGPNATEEPNTAAGTAAAATAATAMTMAVAAIRGDAESADGGADDGSHRPAKLRAARPQEQGLQRVQDSAPQLGVINVDADLKTLDDTAPDVSQCPPMEPYIDPLFAVAAARVSGSGSGHSSPYSSAASTRQVSGELPPLMPTGDGSTTDTVVTIADATTDDAVALAPVSLAPVSGNRRQLSVSVTSTPMSPSQHTATAADAVGVPVLLVHPGTPNGGIMYVSSPTAGAGDVPQPLTARSAANGGNGIDGGFLLVPDPVVTPSTYDSVDLVANVSVAARRTEPTRRRNGGAAAPGPADGNDIGDTGPCGLPSEVRRKLRSQMGRHRAKHIRNWKDLSFCLSNPRTNYWLMATLLLVSVLLGAFLFMAGQYDFVGAQDLSDGSLNLQSLNLDSYNWGPRSLAAYLAFWRTRPSRTFTFEYLRTWGGRYGPDLAVGQWWRWITSLLLHQTGLHLAANMALLLVLCTYLEALYGFWRILPVWLVAGVSGNMLSALFEDSCTLVVGSSGAVFGLLGAYVTDAGLNWESIPLLWLRMLGMTAVVALIVALQVSDSHSGNTSHASHVGGFVTGALAAALLLPDFKARRSNKVRQLLVSLGVGAHLPPPSSPGGRQLYSFWQRHQVLRLSVCGVAVVVLSLTLVGAPIYLYTRSLPNLMCQ